MQNPPTFNLSFSNLKIPRLQLTIRHIPSIILTGLMEGATQIKVAKFRWVHHTRQLTHKPSRLQMKSSLDKWERPSSPCLSHSWSKLKISWRKRSSHRMHASTSISDKQIMWATLRISVKLIPILPKNSLLQVSSFTFATIILLERLSWITIRCFVRLLRDAVKSQFLVPKTVLVSGTT